MTGLLRKKGGDVTGSLAVMRVWRPARQPREPTGWFATVNHQQRAAGIAQRLLPGTPGFHGLIKGLEVNPTLPLMKCQGGQRMHSVLSDKTAPS